MTALGSSMLGPKTCSKGEWAPARWPRAVAALVEMGTIWSGERTWNRWLESRKVVAIEQGGTCA
jgi:hypothetical protein